MGDAVRVERLRIARGGKLVRCDLSFAVPGATVVLALALAAVTRRRRTP
jgi:hypothetical protein